MKTPDLAQHPPRSPRVRLGGYAMLARVIDKGRAALAGKHGDYKYGDPMDQHFLTFHRHRQRGVAGADEDGRGRLGIIEMRECVRIDPTRASG